MLVINKSEMLLRSYTAVPAELLRKFITSMQQELLPGCQFTATIQTSFSNYSDMTVDEFLDIYQNERPVHWNIEFSREAEWAGVSFQHLQQSVDRGVATNNFEAALSKRFRQLVLRQLEVDLS